MDIRAFTLALGDLGKRLEAMGSQAPVILSRSLNRAAATGKTAMVRAIAKDTGMAQKYVNRAVRIDKASRTSLVAAFSISGSRIPLIAFNATGNTAMKGRKRKSGGVSWRNQGRKKNEPNAFITAMRARRKYEIQSGADFIGPSMAHVGVFARTTKERFPVKELRGPSLPLVAAHQEQVFRDEAQAALTKNVAHEIDYALSKLR